MSNIPTLQYFLKSERLGFRCWSQDDLSLARALWGDIAVTRFFAGPFSDKEIGERLHREIVRMKAYNFQYWPIHLLADNEVVGCCGLGHTGRKTKFTSWDFAYGQSIGAKGWHWRLHAL